MPKKETPDFSPGRRSFKKITGMKKIEMVTERLLLVEIDMFYLDDIFKEFTLKVAQYLIPQPTGRKKDTTEFILESKKIMILGKVCN